MPKSHIDSLIKDDPKLQQFLQWADRKTQSVKARYKPFGIRAYYLDLEFDLNLDLDLEFSLSRHLNHDISHDISLAFDLYNSFDRVLEPSIDRTIDLHLDLYNSFDRVLEPSINRTIDLALRRERDLHLDLDFALDSHLAHTLRLHLILARDIRIHHLLAPDIHIDFSLYLDLEVEVEVSFALSLSRAQGIEFKHQLKQLSNRLPDLSPKNQKTFQQWWSTYGEQWAEDLRQVMITHRNIGRHWQFSDEQNDLLQQYYAANILLVQCLNSDCYVSRHVRQSIEDTLLLPYEELKIENIE